MMVSGQACPSSLRENEETRRHLRDALGSTARGSSPLHIFQNVGDSSKTKLSNFFRLVSEPSR